CLSLPIHSLVGHNRTTLRIKGELRNRAFICRCTMSLIIDIEIGEPKPSSGHTTLIFGVYSLCFLTKKWGDEVFYFITVCISLPNLFYISFFFSLCYLEGVVDYALD
ncbi:tetratricopeptide repeat protein, partial [Striga asiatica]